MNDSADFIRAIMANPEDSAVRLIYADWLDEHDKPDVAAKLRQPGRWEILYGASWPSLCWTPGGWAKTGFVDIGDIPADVPVECDQCHVIPTPAILGRACVDDDRAEYRWYCRYCLEYSNAVMMAKLLGQRILACAACSEATRRCRYCRNFRVLVPGGALPLTRDRVTGQVIGNNLPFEIFEPALIAARDTMVAMTEAFRVSAERIGQVMSQAYAAAKLARVDQIADKEGE